MVNYDELREKQAKKAVVHCVELMGLINAEKVEAVSENTFKHTNTRGRVRIFKAMYGWNKYNSWDWKTTKHKLHKVNGFYIAEME